MSDRDKFLIFLIDEQRFALTFDAVGSVVNSTELTPFQSKSDNILGLLNLHGDLIPVLNMRRLLSLPPKNLDLSDQFIICKRDEQLFAMAVDSVVEILNLTISHEKAKQPLAHVQAVANKDDETIYILQVDSILSSITWEKSRA